MKTNKRKIRCLAVFIFLIIALFNISIARTDKEEAQTQDYIISNGETLWSIAQKYKNPEEDTRQYVYEIKKLNNMTNSTIYEGQIIKIIKGSNNGELLKPHI